ncbi:MAG: hypothetical protein K0R39_4775 [Symbiobacteriaceae bacterium]|nr:hypothetical protein [Symbiobacteriaceae bacterium]
MQQQTGSAANIMGADWPQDQQGTALQAQPFGAQAPAYASPYGQAPAYANPYGQAQVPAYAQAQAPAYAQPFGQAQASSYAPPFGQPQGQPYAQPQPQTYVQPYTMPGAQPFAQPQPQPMAQAPYAPPQTQAPPVPPVAAPVAPGVAGGANAQPTPQQQFARHLTGIARLLEQALPSYQLTISLLLDLSVSPKAESVTGIPALLEQLQQATFAHYGALGAIRRFLLGDATPDVLASLAVGINRLTALHSTAKSLWEQALASAPAELRPALAPLNQAVSGVESLLSQAATGVQQAVGPQAWAAAQARAAGAAAAE